MAICERRRLEVRICSDRKTLGLEAASYTARLLKELLANIREVNMVFAAAPSQNEFLHSLIQVDGIDWNRVNAFHLDEYLGLNPQAPQRFANFLNERIFKRVPFKQVHYIDPGSDEPPELLCERYEVLLREHPLHIACIGIGENGHIAFNEPSTADFHDTKMVKVVELDERSRIQQVNDGCFENLEEVPRYAITLTVPAIMRARHILCVVPGRRKSRAVKEALEGPVSTSCPASILRCHRSAMIFLDRDSASLLWKEEEHGEQTVEDLS